MVNLGGRGSGGGLLLGRLNGLTVAEADARDHLREPLGAVQPAPVALGALGELEDHRQRGLARQAALRPLRPQPHRGEGALDRVRRPDVLPVLGRHRVEGEQRLPVLGQAGHSLVVLGTVLGDEAVERGLRLLPVLGLVDGVQVLLGLALQGPRQLVEHVRGFVHPTPLLPGLWPDLVQRLPEAERAVAGRQLGIDDQPVLVAQTEQELAPALGALAEAVLDRQQLLATLGVGPDQDQQALPLVVEPRGEVDAVGPEVDVAAGRQGAPLPARVLPPPGLGQAPDRRRRPPRRVGPEERHQGLRELPGRDALQVEPGQQLLDVPGPSQVGRQDGRAEADRPRAVPAAVADPRSADRERADPGLDVPLRGVPVAHHTSATLAIGEVGVGGDECLHLGLDHLHQHPPRSLAQHRQQRVVRDRRAWLRQRDDGTFLHGVSFLVTCTITEDTPPPAPSPPPPPPPISGDPPLPDRGEPLLPARRFDRREGDPVDAWRALVGTRQIVGVAQDVLATDLVVEQVEAERRLVLRLEIELPLKLPDAVRCCQAHRQSPILGSVASAPEARVLPSADITRHRRYYDPVRLPPASPSGAAARARPSRQAGLPSYPRHPSGVPCPLPRWTAAGASVGCFPAACSLPRNSGGSASTTSLSRPAQASLTLRPVGSPDRPRRPSSRGFGPPGRPDGPLVSYQINRQLSGWNLPPLVARAIWAH